MPFSNFYILIFLILLYWLESLSTMLNKLSDSFCLSLVSKLKGKASNILPLRMWTADGFTCYSFIKIFKIYLFIVALGLCCCAQAFSSSSDGGYSLVAVCGLLTVVASLVAERWLWARGLQ